MATPKIKPIDPNIPTDRAWQTGRRLYLRCGYESTLGKQLRDLGANWDREQRCLWVGSSKRDQVVPLALAAQERIHAIEDVKAAGRWVHIPYDAADIRQRAKDLNAVWDNDRKCWAMRADDHLAEITAAVTVWHTARAAERAETEQRRRAEQVAARQRADQDEKAAAVAAQASRRERLIAESGRISTGETSTFTEISQQFMNKHTAHQMARKMGSIVRLKNNRRGLITGVEIWFTADEWASSVCWHPETHDEAHWDFKYTVEIVEPTDAELAADAAKAAELADAQAIHELMRSVAKLTDAHADDRWTTIPDEERTGTISATTGSTRFRNGTVILANDGRVVWQHPGHYDDYIHSEGISTDPELGQRVRELLRQGNRTRVFHDQQSTYYEVRVHG